MKNKLIDKINLTFLVVLAIFGFNLLDYLLPNASISKNTVYAEKLDPDLYAERFGQLSAVKFEKTLTYEMGGMALDTFGSVWSWGYNLYGTSGVREYGDGTPLSHTGANNGYLGGMRRIEYFVEGEIKIVDISSGYRSHLALDDTGKVYAWGNGAAGEMGNGRRDNNPIPIEVPGLPVITKIFSSNDLGGTSNFALDENGSLWAWGSNTYNQLGIRGFQLSPIQIEIPELETDIVSISSGSQHTQLLDSNGDVWYTGNASEGRLGNGSTSKNAEKFTKMDKPTEMSEIIDIFVGGDSTIALDNNHIIWQWGGIYGKSLAGKEYVASPRIVTIDTNDTDANFNNFYTPIPQKVFSGQSTYYFIDQYNRPWSWGSGIKFGFGTDFGYEDSNDIHKTSAVQLPNIMGDGDTQILTKDEKYPRYLTTPNPNNKKGRLPYLNFGVYSFNALHPTVYDHKYMMRDDKGNYLDDSGNRYQYQNKDAVKEGRYEGFFYKLDKEGLLTTETGVPSIKPDERAWISLAGKSIPQITQISGAYESFVMTDIDGNIYKWGTTGSGTMAWGWDVEDEFDYYPTAYNKRMGLFDRYTYEIMYMRGAPMLPQPSISFNNDMKKIYHKENNERENSEVKATIKIPPVIKNIQLGLDISSQLHGFRAIVMPYDVGDENMNKKTPSDDDIQKALQNPNYHVIDLMDKEGLSKPQTNDSEVDWKELNTSLTVQENSVVWLVADYTAYDHNNHLTAVSVKKYDNYYEEMTMVHKGVNSKDNSQVIYPENQKNVTKLTKDDITKKIGFPVDKNNQIIGTKTEPPTFGYDQVKVEKLSDNQLDEIESNLSKYWLFTSPQSKFKIFTLNGVDVNNSSDLTSETGELAVTKDYIHLFNYEKNPKGYAKLHFVGVDEVGNKIPEFNMSSEEVKKGVIIENSPQDLSQQELLVDGFFVLDGVPPSNYPVNLEDVMQLNESGKSHVEIPFDDSTGINKTVVFLYKPPVKFGDLHIRQVVLDSNSKFSVPKFGYFRLKPAKIANPEWEYTSSVQNVFGSSQQELDKPEYLSYKLSLADKLYKGYGVNSITPQYHEYVGYKIDTMTGNYNNQNIIKDKNIKIDYANNKEYWLTVYIKPTTKIPESYSWDTETNNFGKLPNIEPKTVRIKFYSEIKGEKIPAKLSDLETYGGGILADYYNNLSDYYMRFEINNIYSSKRYKSGVTIEDVLLEASKVDVDSLPKIIPLNYYYTDKSGKEVESRNSSNTANGIENPTIENGATGFGDVRGKLTEIDKASSSQEIVVWYKVESTVYSRIPF